ncbi:hypothetical protein SDRG_11374 [Saprolegnia diclina VS20]|uniref:Uncharacterized protein n=1 Tax=Saprolegnia diclina (strain VS20) TaxID=1156394 RepID=T0RF35_SAPDV|nr:hypothetical protein SDRG_11374 [Saprolegnia diclina VS20]EQC30893.1 hypothetical protein SDRG_11374 [Saprolegnia diclina VS20]|eukprot:XP_008615631.1 hypothetical protein SDRG_11374 [Saprolegnia diclina VS20]
MAYVLGDMMTRALDAHDAYAKASRAVYFWCIAVTPQLDAFQELLMSGHLDDARTVLHSVYIGSADAMKTATGALATTKALLTYVEDEAMLFSARMRTGSLDQTPATTDGTKETIMSETSAHGAMTLVTSETMTTSSALVSLVPEKMQQIRKTIYKAYSACKEASILPWTAQPTTTCPPLTIDITMADALCNLATRLHTMAGHIEMGLEGLATTDVGSLVAKEVQHPKDLGKNARAHCEAASALCNACNEFIRNHKSHYACDLATTL